ncbi:MFS transporter [Frankia sp. Cppng1_Ct_nod]|uniref:MFS transporter n=1 Tax=Frankia sp. Cppng1_Ct_nod TaxID=2897162 RepID=UPI00104171B4|nr:MFS transporter [Frankia sp. Cppng1_Ct_nod]
MTSSAPETVFAPPLQATQRRDAIPALVVPAAVLALLLAAMDATIMGTVLPNVVADVGGRSGGGYAWLVSGFMLAQVAGTPLAGWAADRLDDRVAAVSATLVFLTASLLAGFAGSFRTLVMARMLHGLAAGALVVSSYVIIGRLYGPQRRPAAQSLLSTVWGIAAVVGPPAGASITAAWGWRWVFFVNVPLCLLVIIGIAVALPPKPAAGDRQRPLHRFPTVEYLLITGGTALILIGMQSSSLGLGTAAGYVGIAAGLAMLPLLRRVGGDLLPRDVFAPTPSGAAAIATIGACVVMYATMTVLPVQLAALGASTTKIAFIVGLSAIGWVLGSAVAGGVLTRYGYRLPLILGATALLLSAVCSATGTLPWLAGATAGLGTGMVTAATLALLQDQAPPERLGIATSSATMLRNIGAAAGINGIAALSAALTPSSHRKDPAFWALAAVAVIAVLIPAVSAPRQRKTRR